MLFPTFFTRPTQVVVRAAHAGGFREPLGSSSTRRTGAGQSRKPSTRGSKSQGQVSGDPPLIGASEQLVGTGHEQLTQA